MEYRYAFKNKEKISLLGFGTWQLGNSQFWDGPSIDESIVLVKKAILSGINFFDTAPNYGNGNSEKILGTALKGVRDQVFINTKVGHGPNGESDFTPDGIKKSVEQSLKKLKTDYIDSVILHNPEFYILEGKTNLFKTLKTMKSDGVIRHYGVSIDSLKELETVLNNLDIDVIEILFNINHQEAKALFDEVKKRNILLITKVPLDSGWLTGKYSKDSEFSGIRSRWTKEDIVVRHNIITKIKEIVKTDNLVGPALSFIASFDAVTTIIPGVKNIKQLESNVESINYKLTEKQVALLEDLYDDYIKNCSVPW